MRTRTLGPLEVSVVGLGCNNFGRRIDADATRAVVDAALEVGVTFFDTADVYGNRGGSESILGEVLQGRRDQVVLATKWGAMLDFDEQPHGTREFVRSALDASLRAAADRPRRPLPAPPGGQADAVGRDVRAR